MKRVKRIKPNIDPWENPALAGLSEDLQSFTKNLRLTLVFMINGAVREKFNFCFSRDFC